MKRGRYGQFVKSGRNGGGNGAASRRPQKYYKREPYVARRSLGEKKFFDTDVNDAVVSATMTINNLTIVPEGNGESARIGRKMTIKSVHIRGEIKLPAATSGTNTSDTIILMLVQDKQTNGAQFASTQLIDTDEFKSFNNLANAKRFRILWKDQFPMKNSGAATTGAAHVFAEDMKSILVNKTCNIDMEYDNSANTGAIETVRSNNLYWVTQSSNGLAGITANARIRYIDY